MEWEMSLMAWNVEIMYLQEQCLAIIKQNGIVNFWWNTQKNVRIIPATD